MKFQKTVNIWADGVQESLANGTLVLQTGQWIRCGESGERSRYIGIKSSGCIWAAHYNGSGAARQERFNDLRAAFAK